MSLISTAVDYWGVAGDKEAAVVVAGEGSQAEAACTSDPRGAFAGGIQAADHTSVEGSDHTAAGGRQGPLVAAVGRRGCSPWAWGCTPGRASAWRAEWGREGGQELLKCQQVPSQISLSC